MWLYERIFLVMFLKEITASIQTPGGHVWCLRRQTAQCLFDCVLFHLVATGQMLVLVTIQAGLITYRSSKVKQRVVWITNLKLISVHMHTHKQTDTSISGRGSANAPQITLFTESAVVLCNVIRFHKSSTERHFNNEELTSIDFWIRHSLRFFAFGWGEEYEISVVAWEVKSILIQNEGGGSSLCCE